MRECKLIENISKLEEKNQDIEDGRLTDSHGKVVNFENTVIIMTSNAGTSLKANSIGFSNNESNAHKSRIMDVLKEIFRPEFLNRIDEIIVFNELSRNELEQIVDLMLKEVFDAVHEKGFSLKVSQAAKDFILEKGYDIRYGARPLRRTIQRFIEDKLAELCLKGRYQAEQTIEIDCIDGELIFN